MVCNKNDDVLPNSQALLEQSGCDMGNGFLCSDYQPRPVTDNLSYGFAVTNGVENCCKCFELEWTDGPAVGKKIQVQVINTGGETNRGREFVILTPGGGVGPNPKGCNEQFGYDWLVFPLLMHSVVY
jgi:hypothetical protein